MTTLAVSPPYSNDRTEPAPLGPLPADLLRLLSALGIAPSRGGFCVMEAGPLPGDPEGGEVEPLRAGAVRVYIDEHAGEPLDLARLAQAFGRSKYHLARVFREEEGITPWSYVQQTRIERAKRLLEEDLSLAEVALGAGFYDQSHFTHAFRRATGQTPGAWRRDRKDLQDEDEA